MPHPRCVLLPLPDHQIAAEIDGVERLRWHFGPQYPRPFFYPFLGPASGRSLTRMGHPGAQNHDHHRSIWFAHAKAFGIDFWSENTKARIEQPFWFALEDGDDEAILAVRLHWKDGHDPKPLVEQDLLAAIRPGPEKETFLEIHTTFRPVSEQFEFQKSNFGLFAVRVAKPISGFFGGGTLTSSTGAVGEPDIFGKPARWMDYSGEQPGSHREGITYYDHPSNPGHPSSWHVREDGWMCASVCMQNGRTTTRREPLTLRYLLQAHAGTLDPKRAETVFTEFAQRPGLEVVKAPTKNRQYGARRLS
ncbi:MAG: PmoA family protein [Bacteroidales bacterium]|nr:PmoA family protein [Bacteroidales bacterium]